MTYFRLGWDLIIGVLFDIDDTRDFIQEEMDDFRSS
jgi:hypothetical protein